MIVENGINPNCSELVIRLWTSDRDLAAAKLAEIGIKEYLIQGKYESLREDNDKEWDDEENKQVMIAFKGLPTHIKEAWLRWRKDYDEADRDILRNWGIEPSDTSPELLEEGQSFDENYSSFWLSTYPYAEDGELAVWYHQHCQTQGFPLLQKISILMEAEVEAHDGGSIDSYQSWENGDDLQEEDEDL